MVSTPICSPEDLSKFPSRLRYSYLHTPTHTHYMKAELTKMKGLTSIHTSMVWVDLIHRDVDVDVSRPEAHLGTVLSLKACSTSMSSLSKSTMMILKFSSLVSRCRSSMSEMNCCTQRAWFFTAREKALRSSAESYATLHNSNGFIKSNQPNNTNILNL